MPTFPSVADLTKTLDGLPENTDLQGWNSDHPIFDNMVSDLQPKRIIEVGTWKGRSAAHFAKATEAIGTEIFCVDTWLGGVDHALSVLPQDNLFKDEHGDPGLYRLFLRNFAGSTAAGRVFPVRQTSVNAAKILFHNNVQADLIYVDGSHEYDDVYADLCAYWPLLAPQGRMFGDDFRMPGVFAAVIRFAHERGRRIKEVDHNFWVLLS